MKFNKEQVESARAQGGREKGQPWRPDVKGFGVVVKPVNLDPSNVGKDTLEFDAVVESSFAPGAKKGDQVKVRVGEGMKSGTDMMGNIMQGMSPTVNFQRLVLEDAVAADGVMNARWASKAGGNGRQVMEGLYGPQVISFRGSVPGKDGTRKERALKIVGQYPGDKHANEWQKNAKVALQEASDGLRDAIKAGDEDGIKAKHISVYRETLENDAAVLCEDTGAVPDQLVKMAGEGYPFAALRFFNKETKEVLTGKVGLFEINNADNKREVAEKVFSGSLAYLYEKKGSGMDAFEKAEDHVSLEVIPMDRVYIPFNRKDAAKNGTLRAVNEYMETSEKAAYFQNSRHLRNEFIPMISIHTVHTDESGQERVGGVTRFIYGDASARSTVQSVKTAHCPGGPHIEIAEGAAAEEDVAPAEEPANLPEADDDFPSAEVDHSPSP